MDVYVAFNREIIKYYIPGGLSMNIADLIVAGIDTMMENRKQIANRAV